jgi:hypothetical protein
VLVEGATVSTLLPVGVTELVLNEQIAPAGQVDPTLSATGELNPLIEARLTVDVPEAPCSRETDVGLAEIEKSAALTVTAKVVVWVSAELTVSTPFTVTVYVPAGVLDAVATVSVEVAPGEAVPGLNEQVAFAGHPEDTLRFTVPL